MQQQQQQQWSSLPQQLPIAVRLSEGHGSPALGYGLPAI
jgi:hypothetical protein